MDAVLLESGPTSRLAAAHSADKNFRGEKEFVSGEGSCHPERNADHYAESLTMPSDRCVLETR